jgi:hypothetical protein
MDHACELLLWTMACELLLWTMHVNCCYGPWHVTFAQQIMLTFLSFFLLFFHATHHKCEQQDALVLATPTYLLLPFPSLFSDGGFVCSFLAPNFLSVSSFRAVARRSTMKTRLSSCRASTLQPSSTASQQTSRPGSTPLFRRSPLRALKSDSVLDFRF